MAMINPPIEVMIKKADSKYKLVSLLSKRAKELLLTRPDFFLENMKVKPLEMAAEEYYEGKTREPHKKNSSSSDAE